MGEVELGAVERRSYRMPNGGCRDGKRRRVYGDELVKAIAAVRERNFARA